MYCMEPPEAYAAPASNEAGTAKGMRQTEHYSGLWCGFDDAGAAWANQLRSLSSEAMPWAL